MFLYFIGTGGSEGVPRHNGTDEHSKLSEVYSFIRRKQPSILIIGDDYENILIDVGTDITQMFPRLKLDAILLTHWHHDHIAGLYTLRWSENKIPLYALPDGDKEIVTSPKNLQINFINEFSKFKIGNINVTSFPLNHTVPTIGYLLEENKKKVAIITDTKLLPEKTEQFLKKNKPNLCIIDAIYNIGVNASNHNNIDEACEIGLELHCDKIVLYHIAYHNMDFFTMTKYVREKYGENIIVSYDGMILYV